MLVSTPETTAGRTAAVPVPLTRTLSGSTTSTEAIEASAALTVDCGSVSARSKLALIASASTGLPSENVTPSRRVNSTDPVLGRLPLGRQHRLDLEVLADLCEAV